MLGVRPTSLRLRFSGQFRSGDIGRCCSLVAPLEKAAESFHGSEFTLHEMRVYALVEVGDNQTVDVFVRPEEAFEALAAALSDEPDWARTLCVVPADPHER